jgi:hypothetical protein
MSRFVLASIAAAALAALAVASCSKSAGSQEGAKRSSTGGTDERIAVPGATGAPGGAGAAGGAGPAQDDETMKLKPEEGKLSIEVPPDAVAGKETTARVMVIPTGKYHINFEFSTKLTLQPPADVTLAKAELKAGGQAKSQGDAEKFEEKQLAFAVKLTPTKSGTHTINGTFKFAVCDKDQCLAKREPIAIQVAAK